MTLGEAIKQLEADGETISLGTKNGGNGYIFIGKVNEKKIAKVFEDYRKNLDKSYKENVKKLKQLYRKPKLEEFRPINPVLESVEKYECEKEKFFEQQMELWAFSINRAFNRIRYCRSYISGYTDPFSRKVLDIYPRETEEGVAVIIDGYEAGSLWWEHEEFDFNGKKGRKRKESIEEENQDE